MLCYVMLCYVMMRYSIYLYFEMEPSVSVNFISGVTSCAWLWEEEPQTACPLHGRLIYLLACSRDVKLGPISQSNKDRVALMLGKMYLKRSTRGRC